jgi:hypothetical protein
MWPLSFPVSLSASQPHHYGFPTRIRAKIRVTGSSRVGDAGGRLVMVAWQHDQGPAVCLHAGVARTRSIGVTMS